MLRGNNVVALPQEKTQSFQKLVLEEGSPFPMPFVHRGPLLVVTPIATPHRLAALSHNLCLSINLAAL